MEGGVTIVASSETTDTTAEADTDAVATSVEEEERSVVVSPSMPLMFPGTQASPSGVLSWSVTININIKKANSEGLLEGVLERVY